MGSCSSLCHVLKSTKRIRMQHGVIIPSIVKFNHVWKTAEWCVRGDNEDAPTVHHTKCAPSKETPLFRSITRIKSLNLMVWWLSCVERVAPLFLRCFCQNHLQGCPLRCVGSYHILHPPLALPVLAEQALTSTGLYSTFPLLCARQWGFGVHARQAKQRRFLLGLLLSCLCAAISVLWLVQAMLRLCRTSNSRQINPGTSK
jgi:hypothetical protein